MSKDIKKIFSFLHEISKIKTTYRFETVKGVEGDSVSDHSWRLAMMVFIVADELKLDVNVLHCIKLALIHDLPEMITGDLDPEKMLEENITKRKKQIAEEKAINKIKKTLPRKLGNEIFDLWCEYEKNKTKEARYVKALDRIEGIMSYLELKSEKIKYPHIVGSKGNENIKRFPEILNIFKLLKKEVKKEFKNQSLEWKKEYDDYL